MTISATQRVDAFALGPDEGDARWFLGALGMIKADAATTGGKLGLIEFLWPYGGGSPLHVHREEDEWFYVIEGELTLWLGGETIVAPAGSFVYGPRNIPHTFVVSSAVCRFLMVTDPAPFADFVRAGSVPAEALSLAPASVEPPSPEELTAIAAEYGIEVLGPPGIPA